MSFLEGWWNVPKAMQADLIAALGLVAGTFGVEQAAPSADPISVQILREGSGAAAQSGDLATVHFVVRTKDGKELANSFKRGMSYTVELGEPGDFWTTVLEGLRVGGMSRLSANSSHFFGKNGILGIIPADTELMADVKLLKVEKSILAKRPESGAKSGQG
jgi:FKBP-type peptidyl-prolyl cis-trans isomerase